MDLSQVEGARRLSAAEREALLQLLALVHGTGVDYFVCSGTMLGLARHGDIIPWDEDADVSVKLEHFDELLRRLAAAGAHLVRMPGLAQARLLSAPSAVLDIYAVSRAQDGRWVFAAPVDGDVPLCCLRGVYPKEAYEDDVLFPTQVYPFAGGRMEVRGPRRLEDACRQAYGPECMTVAKAPLPAVLPHGTALGTACVCCVVHACLLCGQCCKAFVRLMPPPLDDASRGACMITARALTSAIQLALGQSLASSLTWDAGAQASLRRHLA